MKSAMTVGDTVTKTFNASDTSWTISVTRNRVGLFGRQAGFARTYYLKVHQSKWRRPGKIYYCNNSGRHRIDDLHSWSRAGQDIPLPDS